ncbi:esterase YqiA [Alteromonas pelagimontana]|uniref:Esterase YqiA n=1 Tax=Alteromonas pelagimontana TaxID=1858656 RepID=A0A6M4MBH0_9ALTE|nr:YqiA/YcfP family alpha/beta fold hydrolase [Alteromonas pelagimontana]QJR80377.1 esterase YqiA [Alteromonas pelagimontana]
MSDVLYLHGFLSSPRSIKAEQTKAYIAANCPACTLHIPQLSNYPTKVVDQLLTLIETTPSLTAQGLKVIGSSMGGFLASWLVEKYGGKAVLVNPAVKPYELLIDYLGEHVNPYNGEKFVLLDSDMGLLQSLDSAQLADPTVYRVMLQTGDTTLDYRQAQQKYASSTLLVEEGGDHSFVDYAKHLPDIAAFLGVLPDSSPA